MTALVQRQPRIEDAAYLAYVRTLPCLVCGRGPSDPAHLRSSALRYGKRQTGMGEKPDDKWALPLCRHDHDAQHRTNELRWWASKGIPDPFAVAIALYASRPNARRPRQEPQLRRSKLPRRKPPAQRRTILQRNTLESRPNWPPTGSRKFPTRAKERTP